MKKAILLAGALLAVSASLASAAGLNLGWTNCGTTGVLNKSFACNSNTAAANKLYGSYVAPAGTTAITGNEIVVDLQSSAPTLPAWWNLFTAGSCRSAALSANFIDPTGAAGDCVDYWGAQASGGVGAYNTNVVPGATNRARILIVAAVAPANAVPVDVDVEYYSFTLSITNTKTTGSGACAGCLDPVCLVLNEIKLTQPAGVGDIRIQNPATRNYVTWQNGVVSGGCPAATPARNTTWGQVKSLYR